MLRRNSIDNGDQSIPAAKNTTPDSPPHPDPLADSDLDAETISTDPNIAATIPPWTGKAKNSNLLHRLSQKMFDLVFTTDMEEHFKSIKAAFQEKKQLFFCFLYERNGTIRKAKIKLIRSIAGNGLSGLMRIPADREPDVCFGC